MVCAGWPSSQRNSTRLHPDFAVRNERLVQHRERPRLREIAGPALQIGLHFKPLVELRIVIGGAQPWRPRKQK